LPCARNKTHGKDFDARQTRVFPLCALPRCKPSCAVAKPLPRQSSHPPMHRAPRGASPSLPPAWIMQPKRGGER
jgi:hypothetical protein